MKISGFSSFIVSTTNELRTDDGASPFVQVAEHVLSGPEWGLKNSLKLILSGLKNSLSVCK